uniref:Uncharacterized protein n=1 Tax=Oryza barthii TaxID=65489 RepID=A0A0D3FSW7_9ORYZ
MAPPEVVAGAIPLRSRVSFARERQLNFAITLSYSDFATLSHFPGANIGGIALVYFHKSFAIRGGVSGGLEKIMWEEEEGIGDRRAGRGRGGDQGGIGCEETEEEEEIRIN